MPKPNKRSEPSDELTTEEAAQVLGVSVATVYNLVKRGLLKKFKKPYGKGVGGRSTYFLRAELEALARGETDAEK